MEVDLDPNHGKIKEDESDQFAKPVWVQLFYSILSKSIVL
jgi:hypothetical protein